MCGRMMGIAVMAVGCLLMFTPRAQADDIVWDFENGNDHGFLLQSLVPATPAPQDPDRAGDESITGVGGPNGLPNAGIAWTICDLYEFEGLLPAITEGNNIINGRLVPTNSLPQGRGPSQLGQTGYLNTYAITMWGDNLHTATNDQVATSPLVDLGQGSVMTVHALGGTGTYRAPEHDPDPAQWYLTGSCGIAILNQSGEIVESLFMPSQNWAEYTVDLSHLAGQKVTIEVVDAFEGGWGWIAIDQIRITNAKVIGGVGLARNPSPDDQATDVPLDVTLSWTAGEFAATHDVYFGTAFADVNDASRAMPMGVLASQDQTGAVFDPGTLEFGRTYYWRIDEVNSAPDFTIFKGNVWSFTTEPFAYPVENVVATSNGISEAGAGPENTVDGSGLDADDRHSIDAADMWLADPPDDEVLYIQYEFDRVYKLHEMLVWNYNVQFELVLGFGLKDVTIEYSIDGAEWMVLGDAQFARATARAGYVANTVVDLQGVAAQFVRVTVNSGWGSMGQFGLSEVRFLYIPAHARQPQPADGAANVSVDSTLAWRAGRDAVSHEVYFGTDPDALNLVATVEGASYDPGALNLGATYYWQVNAVQEAESRDGNLWSFATQEYLVVDDFESYTDDIDASEAIFDTWLDGWVNDTGSTVGYIEAPFAERTIVRSGRQSMPLFYDNTEAAVSEADLELAANWTTNGIRSLSLHFYGDPDNTGQLYVKINNTKVPYDGAAADIKRAAWQPWNIDLSAVGNVSNVGSLTIGIEGAGATGVVYIDDIRLYPHAPEFIVPGEPDTANLVAQYAFDGNANDGSVPGSNRKSSTGREDLRKPAVFRDFVGVSRYFTGASDYSPVRTSRTWKGHYEDAG